VRSRPPPSVKPAARPQSRRPLRGTILESSHHDGTGSGPEGPTGLGVNGLTLGPLRLLGQLTPAGQGLPLGTRASLSLICCES
jgi:hypothetical protein